jgi:predicted phosphodiesterase
MRFNVISDLHIDTHKEPLVLTGGENLFVVGDICDANNLNPERAEFALRASHQTFTHEYLAMVKEFAQARLDNLREQFAKYKNVYIVLGNHDYYGTTFEEGRFEMETMFPTACVLDNELVQLGENKFLFGGTMWTDFNNDPLLKWDIRTKINDFIHIRTLDHEKGRLRRWHPEDHVRENATFVERLTNVIDVLKKMGPNMELMVATHFVPTALAGDQRFARNTLNPYWINEMQKFIYDNPMIKLWVHGHTHAPCDFKMGECRIVCNPRGYGREHQLFDPTKTVDF